METDGAGIAVLNVVLVDDTLDGLVVDIVLGKAVVDDALDEMVVDVVLGKAVVDVDPE